MMEYFELFGIEPAFLIDEEALRQRYYANSKRFHPDFFTLESDEKQKEILHLSSLNNEAYQVLSDFDRRMKYILMQRGALEEEGQNPLPQAFLLEMMEINEGLMELEFDFEESVFQSLLAKLRELETSLFQEVLPHLKSHVNEQVGKEQLFPVKEYYLKKRYLLRIKENLSKFANR